MTKSRLNAADRR